MTVKATQDRFESYEVFDEAGNSVGRVILPRSRRMFGSSRGTVYLNRPAPKAGAAPTNPKAA